jgi:hypothetical protein
MSSDQRRWHSGPFDWVHFVFNTVASRPVFVVSVDVSGLSS